MGTDLSALYGTIEEVVPLDLSCDPKPSAAAVSCSDLYCYEYGGEKYIYKLPATLSVTVSDFGETCDDQVDNQVVFVVAGSYFTSSTQQVNTPYEFTITSLPELSSNEQIDMTLTVNGMSVEALPLLKKCVVPTPIGDLEIISDSYSYYDGSKPVDVQFRRLDGLYSECFGKTAGYYLEVRRGSAATFEKILDGAAGDITISSETSAYPVPAEQPDSLETSAELTISLSVPTTYTFRVLAEDVTGAVVARSSEFTIQYCTAPSSLSDQAPQLLSPANGEVDAAVSRASFKFAKPNTLFSTLKCSPLDRVFLALDLQPVGELPAADSAPATSVATASLGASSITLRNTLLRLSTEYAWQIKVMHTSPTAPENITTEVFKFTTKSMDCAYVNCNNGDCDEATFRCKCHTGFHGKFCKSSGLESSAIAGIVAAAAVIFIVMICVVVFFLRRASVFGLKIPDLSKYLFIKPKPVDAAEGVPQESLEKVADRVYKDPYNYFEWAVALLTQALPTEEDSVCRALVYAFEYNGEGLQFVLSLIGHEVGTSSQETLFRSNSYATKCFKTYARMVGLPYLFRTLYPLMGRLVKEEQRRQAGVRLEGRTANFDGVETLTSSSNFELDVSRVEEPIDNQDEFVETNALEIQLACELFFSNLRKTVKYCPEEFKKICNVLKTRVSERFPDIDTQLALSAFLFLRFFVTGISVPETLGILNSPPSEEMRKRLIIISKVISNVSMGRTFSGKEECMEVMNGYIEAKAACVREYFDRLTVGIPDDTKPVRIPEKYYTASLEVIAQMQTRLKEGE